MPHIPLDTDLRCECPKCLSDEVTSKAVSTAPWFSLARCEACGWTWNFLELAKLVTTS